MAAAPSEPSACRGSATSVGRSPLTRVARSLRCAREPVGLSLEGAAALIGVSASLFTRAVQEGLMPRPRRLFGRLLFDADEVITAYRRLPRGWGEPEDETSVPPWGEVAV